MNIQVGLVVSIFLFSAVLIGGNVSLLLVMWQREGFITRTNSEILFNRHTDIILNQVNSSIRNSLNIYSYLSLFFNRPGYTPSVQDVDVISELSDRFGYNSLIYWGVYTQNRSATLQFLREEFNDPDIDIGYLGQGTVVRGMQPEVRNYDLLTRRWSPKNLNNSIGLNLLWGNVPAGRFDVAIFNRTQSVFKLRSQVAGEYAAILFTPCHQLNRTDVLGGLVKLETPVRIATISVADSNELHAEVDGIVVVNGQDDKPDDLVRSQRVSVANDYVDITFRAQSDYGDFKRKDTVILLNVIVSVLTGVGFLILAIIARRFFSHYQQTQHKQVASEVKQRFIDYIFHELRNPFQVIRTTFDLLDNHTEVYRSAQLALEDAQVLLDNVLEASSMESGNNFNDTHFIDLVEIMDSSRVKYAQLYAVHSRSLTFHFNPSTHTMLYKVDRHRVMQCMSNLLSNALKYTVPGDSVDVYISASSHGFMISVSDTGVGIPEEKQSKLFLEFSKVQGKSQAEGTGLGLALVRRIVNHYNGSCFVRSAGDNCGSTFTLTFQCARQHKSSEEIKEVQADRTITPTPMKLDGLHFLLVDDSTSIQAVMKALLHKQGAFCMCASDGKKGIQQWEQHKDKVDIILMDKTMPGMSGGETTERLRQLGCRIPVIMLTGNVVGDIEESMRQCGVDMIISKPITIQKLASGIEIVMKKYSDPLEIKTDK
jgi:signal transduction histidine kinase/ActR/RegA family two-component response regulator